jgi:ribosomal protein S18 acetylase RimI-like enzyme
VHRRPAEIRLVDIAFLPEFRSGGLGTSILRDLLAEGEAAGKPVTIHVEVYNPAMRLYERLGFRSVEERGPYRLMEWRAASPQLNTAS